GLSCHVEERAIAPVEPLATLELTLLLRRDRRERPLVDARHPHHFLVYHPHVAARDGAHGQFLVAGHAQLAHEEDVERGSELLRHLISHGHAPAREREDHHVGTARQAPQVGGEPAAGFTSIPVAERWHVHGVAGASMISEESQFACNERLGRRTCWTALSDSAIERLLPRYMRRNSDARCEQRTGNAIMAAAVDPVSKFADILVIERL